MTVNFDHLSSTGPVPDEAAVIEGMEAARAQVAAFIGTAHAAGITFTSGVDESMNQLVKGAAWSRMRRGRRLAIAATEHLNVQQSAAWLSQRGWERLALAVDSDGRVQLAGLDEEVVLVSIAAANQETGVCQNMAELVSSIRGEARHAVIISDVSALAGRGPIRVDEWGVDAIALDARVLGGPAGVGVTWIRQGLRLDPLVHGGGQQNGRRAGLVNHVSAMEMGAACEAVSASLEESITSMTENLNRFKKYLAGRMLNPQYNTPADGAAAGILNLGFPPVAAEPLAIEVSRLGMHIASSSACAASAGAVSHVLLAMGRPDVEARAAIRIAIGPETESSQMDALIDALEKALRSMRRLA